MSSIDAAIIKALVEHIGGDSSGIPDGAIGGGGGRTYLDATWSTVEQETGGPRLTFTLPEGETIGIGTGVQLRGDSGQHQVMYCIKEDVNEDGQKYFAFKYLDNLSTGGQAIWIEDGVYRTRWATLNTLTPDNINSGIFKPSLEDITNLLMNLINTSYPLNL